MKVKVPEHPPGNLFSPPLKVLMSQGEVRPGMLQGQHWGPPPLSPPPPLLSRNINVSIR